MADRVDHRDFNDRSTLECQLFNWEEWDEIETGVMNFSGVTLKVAVGHFPAGEFLSHATLDTTHSVVILYESPEDEVGHTYALKITVGEKIDNAQRDQK